VDAINTNTKNLQPLIAVVPDEALKMEPKDEKSTEKQETDWRDIAKTAGNVIYRYYTGVYTTQAIKAVYDFVKKVTASELPVQIVGISSAGALTFPPGHPRPKVIYAQHPADAVLYFPVASFHRRVFEHKFGEAVRLLGALGAREIYVEHKKGWSRDFAADISGPIPVSVEPVHTGVSVGVAAKAAENLLFKASLKGSDTPQLLENSIWLPHESTWQAVVDMRMKYGLRDFSLSLNYEEDYQVNAGLKVEVEKVGFEIGGKFEDHVATVWTMSGRFGSES
jgi:hypothetical protein